jgi:hypothetical protein
MAGVSVSDEGGVNVPIELPGELNEFLKQPRCLDLSLPKPKTLNLALPTGGRIPAINDFTQGIPSDCSLGFSLLIQLGPLLGSLDCIIKILNLVKPLSDVINGLPFPPAKALKEFGEAVEPVVKCAVAFTPQGALPLFIKDILCLVIKLVSCLIDQLKSIVALMGSLSLQLTAAEGNEQLLANVECAQQNAQCAADGAMKSFEPVLVILELVAPLIEIVPAVDPIEIPTFGSTEDVEQIEGVIATMEEFRDTLQLVADGLGGCE